MRILLILLFVFPILTQADSGLSRNDWTLYAIVGSESSIDEEQFFPTVLNIHENSGNAIGINFDVEKRWNNNWSTRFTGYGESRETIFGLDPDAYAVIDYQGPEVNLLRGYLSYQRGRFGFRGGIVDTRIDNCLGDDERYTIHPSVFCRKNNIELIDSGLGIQAFYQDRIGNFFIDAQAGYLDPEIVNKEEIKVLTLFNSAGVENTSNDKYSAAVNFANIKHNYAIRLGLVTASVDSVGSGISSTFDYVVSEIGLTKYWQTWEAGITYYDTDLTLIFDEGFAGVANVATNSTVYRVRKTLGRQSIEVAYSNFDDRGTAFGSSLGNKQDAWMTTYQYVFNQNWSTTAQWTHATQELENSGLAEGPLGTFNNSTDVYQVRVNYRF